LTGICLNVNGDRAGGAYGYVDMGGWIGGQAEYVMVVPPISTYS
jgi:glutathione-independent formaldehyde dehydrogenase